MDTRTKLIVAAERVFAEYGANGATSRMILEQAKQRNASALSYHFSDRAELMEAIVKFRIEGINEERMQRLLDYLANLPPPSERLRALIGIAFLPSVKPIKDAKGKSFFRRFLAAVIANPSANFSALFQGKYDGALQQTSTLIYREVSHLPLAIASKRVTAMYRSISYMTAHIEARCSIGAWKDRHEELDAELELLIDGYVGFMQAPHNARLPAKSVAQKPGKREPELYGALL